MNPDYKTSVDYLKKIQPAGPWNVIAIEPDGPGITGKSFVPGEEDDMAKWLEAQGHTRNIYYTLNTVMRPIDKKPSRKDIKEMAYLHVDLDPRAREDVDEEKRRILAQCEAMQPKPTIVVFSGGGYQAIWKLAEPVPINGKEDAYDQAKLYNLQLEQLYDADHCHNVDRIMRLPGTINRPDKRKREKGRTEQLAEVVWHTDAVYDIGQFTKCQMVQSADQGLTKNSVKISGNVKRLPDLKPLEDAGVGNLCRLVIAKGNDPDDLARWESRSDALWWVVCEMVRKGVDDDTIYAIITDPDWSISAHVLDQSRPHDYAVRQIERAHDFAIDPKLDELNSKYAVVQLGGKVKILKEDVEPFTADEDRPVVHYMSFNDFKGFYMNQLVSVPSPNGKGSNATPLGLWWLSHPERRSYDSVVFMPGARTTQQHYNLWKGFAVEARPGDCSLFLNHVRENICQGDEELYNYLVGWMARLIQRPDLPGETCVVFRGKPGVGKGFFAKHLGRLLGRHYLPVMNSDHIFGKFNHHLKETVLLFADECFGVSDKKQESMLKALITEATVVSESKGMDARLAPNYLHLIMASNEDWVVPIGNFDRRFFVLDVGDRHCRSREYFGGIVDQLEAGGYEALLHFLISYDLTGYDVTAIPRTDAHLDQATYTMDPTSAWWFNKLSEGRIGDTWPDRVWADEFLYDYSEYMRQWGGKFGPVSPVRLGKFLHKVLPDLVGSSKTERDPKKQASGDHMIVQMNGEKVLKSRPYFWVLPTLEEARAHWDRVMGAIPWNGELQLVDVPQEGNF